jgi:hypothetical protein
LRYFYPSFFYCIGLSVIKKAAKLLLMLLAITFILAGIMILFYWFSTFLDYTGIQIESKEETLKILV